MKVSIAAAALILALSAIPYSHGQCSFGSGSVDSSEYCCDEDPFCCAKSSSSGCALKGCTAENIVRQCDVDGGSITFGVECEYEEPVQCGENDCDGLVGGSGEDRNCPKKCKEGPNTDCNKEPGDLCEVDKPDCPVDKEFNPSTCGCGCEVDLDCLIIDEDNPCPECINGSCERRSCPSNKACCKRTRGNDLVCSQGCGKQNICLDNLIDGGPYCERPALALCSALCPEGGCPVPGTEDMFYDAFDDCANP